MYQLVLMTIEFPSSFSNDEKKFIRSLLINYDNLVIQHVVHSRTDKIIIRKGLHATFDDPVLHFNIMILSENVDQLERHVHIAQGWYNMVYIYNITPELTYVFSKKEEKVKALKKSN